MNRYADCTYCGGEVVEQTIEYDYRRQKHLMVVSNVPPAEVRLSRSDDNVRLFYEFYTRTRVGGKWLCVVVKYLPGDAFVITAYLTDTLKAGETVWPKR